MGTHGEVIRLGVRLEVVGDLVLGDESVAFRRERHAGQPVVARRGEQQQRVPPLAPCVADAFVGVEDHEVDAALGELVPDRQSRLAASDDDGVEVLVAGLVQSVGHGRFLSCRLVPTYREPGGLRIARTPHFLAMMGVGRRTTRGVWCEAGLFLTAHAVAADRDDTPILVKMFETCRSTVRSLTTRSAAIDRLVAPELRRRITSTSLSVSPAGHSDRDRCTSPSMIRTSGAAPSSTNTARAASYSRSAAPASPRARRARPRSTLVRASS